MEINQLLESANGYKSLQADTARLADKWAQSGLLEGFSNDTEKNNMAMILENQAKQIVAEQSSTGTGAGFTAQAGAGENWAGVALPLVRKVFAQIAARFCFCTANELAFRSCFLSRFQIWRSKIRK